MRYRNNEVCFAVGEDAEVFRQDRVAKDERSASDYRFGWVGGQVVRGKRAPFPG
jgi:hypothetical protein